MFLKTRRLVRIACGVYVKVLPYAASALPRSVPRADLDRLHRGCSAILTLALSLVASAWGCARPVLSPSLPFEQHTLRVQLAVDSEGFAALTQYQPLVGRIGLKRILQAEGAWPPDSRKRSVQLLVHYGRFYVVGEGFRAVWEITPHPGTAGASFRPAVLLAAPGEPPAKGVRLSRYGSSGSSCLRIDREGGPTVFITAEGKLDDRCP
jgi:hypothetical protein